MAVLPGQPALLTATGLLVLALVLQLAQDRLAAHQTWVKTRSRVERARSLGMRYQMLADPIDGREEILNELGHLEVWGAPDPRWDERLRAPLSTRMQWYADARIHDQLEYYRCRSRRLARGLMMARATLVLLYVTVIVLAWAQLRGWLQVELIGPVVAVIAGLQSWTSVRRWTDTLELYRRTERALGQAKTAFAGFGSLKPTSRSVEQLVREVEGVLTAEHASWAELLTFDPDPSASGEPTRARHLTHTQALLLAASGRRHEPRPLTVSAALTAQGWQVSDGRSTWTVAPEIFEATYEAAGDGSYVKTAPVMARRLNEEVQIVTLEGPARGQPDDVLLAGPAGDVWIQSASLFASRYLTEEESV